MRAFGDAKTGLEVYLALAPDETVSMMLGLAARELAIRAPDDAEGKVLEPEDVVKVLLDGGAFRSGEDWQKAAKRARIYQSNCRRLYSAAAIIANASRPQG